MGSLYTRNLGDYTVIEATIAASASQSTQVDIQNHVHSIAIEIPNAWDTAAITFLGSRTSGGTFRPIYGDTGTEISVTVGATNEMIALDSTKVNAIKSFRYIKLRSGTKASPVAQEGSRTMYVMVK